LLFHEKKKSTNTQEVFVQAVLAGMQYFANETVMTQILLAFLMDAKRDLKSKIMWFLLENYLPRQKAEGKKNFYQLFNAIFKPKYERLLKSRTFRYLRILSNSIKD